MRKNVIITVVLNITVKNMTHASCQFLKVKVPFFQKKMFSIIESILFNVTKICLHEDLNIVFMGQTGFNPPKQNNTPT